ncbi:hypothetical protein CALCODRAFT_486203 [Calocera cornea HHB12733]|uniref:ATP-dependent DNA helicase n=1 Tax=Calocera cornea HHB12733 TaxID=1353952 RepID=A0A165DUX4_9BASI|nr:hypothetical protein CALCODRAFT_486203 [Calocera cornea HHB12733]
MTRIFRQKEEKFLKMLAEVRVAAVGPESAQLLRDLERPVKWPDGVVPVELYTHVDLVLAANQRKLDSILAPQVTYKAEDTYVATPLSRKVALRLFDKMHPLASLSLKIGAKVVLIRNLHRDSPLVKGRFGYVRGFATNRLWQLRDCKVDEFTVEELSSVPPSTMDDYGETIYPIVEFEPIGDFDAVCALVEAQDWIVEDYKKRMVGERHQDGR